MESAREALVQLASDGASRAEGRRLGAPARRERDPRQGRVV